MGINNSKSISSDTEIIHSADMLKIISEYQNSSDPDIYDFVQKVLCKSPAKPLVIGQISDKCAKEIHDLTGIDTTGNNIIITPDDIRHIIKRHGPNGKADHSMKDVSDIARLKYILNNYDTIEWNGKHSTLYQLNSGEQAPQISIKKRVDGSYYVIEVISDSKKKRNIITSVYLKKASD